MENVPAIIDDNSDLKGVVERVSYRTNEMKSLGEIVFPDNYNPGNALKSAHLILSANPNVQNCDKSSIANSLFNMLLLGLHPIKKQVDFIVYKKPIKTQPDGPTIFKSVLTAQPSYFGEMAMVKRFCGAIDIIANLVYKQDIFEFKYDNSGGIIINKHESKLENWDENLIQGAYATVIFPDRQRTELMSISRIKKSWEEMSKTYMIKQNGQKIVNTESTHQKFTGDMVKRTVIRYVCKYLLNSSDDYNVTKKTITEVSIENKIEKPTEAKIIDFAVPDAPETANQNQDIKESEPLNVHTEHGEIEKQKSEEDTLNDIFAEAANN